MFNNYLGIYGISKMANSSKCLNDSKERTKEFQKWLKELVRIKRIKSNKTNDFKSRLIQKSIDKGACQLN